MNLSRNTSPFTGLLLLTLAGTSLAAPGLDVRSIGTGPITPGFAPAGPPVDPTTQNGQWFLTNNGLEDFRTHELHDNISQFGGGPNEHLAISGGFQGYTFNGSGLVDGYQMLVSITNNTHLSSGPWASQPNTHGETRIAPYPNHVGTMYAVRFVAHWADDGNPNNFQQTNANIGSDNPPPTFPVSPGTSNTYANNYDALAWYSYTSGSAGVVGGAYQVPSWDFGNIAIGQTVSQLLTFSFYEPLNPTLLPAPSDFLGQDLLIARSDDIKIGAYFQSDPVFWGILDRFQPYPPGSFNPLTAHYSNSSVFYSEIPAPATGLILTTATLFALRRRRA